MAADLKIIFIGDSGSGKSAFIYRWLHNEYPESLPFTIGSDYERPTPDKNSNVTGTLDIWDTSGNASHRDIITGHLNAHLRDTNLCVIAIAGNQDITSKRNQLLYWRNLINRCKKSSTPRVIILETKTDIQSENQQYATLAQENLEENEMLIPVSAKNGSGLDRFKQEVNNSVKQIKESQPKQINNKPENLIKAQSVSVGVSKKQPIKQSPSLFGLFCSRPNPEQQRFKPNLAGTTVIINRDLDEKAARTILEKLEARLIEGAITDKNKEPYEVSFFGSDYVEFTINDKKRREIKIPKTVAEVLTKIYLVLNNPPSNTVTAKDILIKCYAHILKAANSPRLTRYKSTQQFYEETLPKFIEEEVEFARPIEPLPMQISPSIAAH